MYAATTVFTIWLLALASSGAATKVTEGVYSVPLKRIRNQAAYGIDLMVGNPPQSVTVLADTGSNTYSFESPGVLTGPASLAWQDDELCMRGLCHEFGTFDNTTSSTSVYSGSGFNNVVSDHGYGSFLNDTIWVGGEVFPNMRFGYVEGHFFTRTLDQQIVPIVGLGALCITRECNTTETFIQGLYSRGIISRRAFSLYLGPNDPDATGTLLIGGVDKAKRQGAIYKRKMREPTSDGALSQPNQIEVRAYSLVKSNGTRFDFAYPQETASYHLWDSGSPRWYMPEELFWEVAAYFGLPNTVDPAEAHYKVDCAYRQPTEDVLVVSMIDGADIPIAMHSLVTKVGDRCSIDVGGWDGAMGDSFLRGVYVTFDYDDLTVEFAQVKYTGETDIVKIE